MTPSIYRPLPGRGRSSNVALSTRHRLWLAPDHLLSVANQGYTEDYKRFQLKDIQSIALQKTRRGRIINFVLAGVTLGFAGLALCGWRLQWDMVGVWMLAGVGAFFLLGLLINAALGATCICTLRTAVQAERLYALPRVRPALRAIRLIREAVETAQGALSPEAIDAASMALRSGGAVTTARSHEAASLTAKGIKPYRSLAHAALFSVLLIDACHSAVAFAWQSVTTYLLGLCILFALLSSIIVALIRQADTDLDARLKRTTWWAMGYVMVSYVLNTAMFYVFLGLTGGAAPGTQMDMWSLMRSMWMTSPLKSPAVFVTVAFSLVGSAVLGTVGGLQWLVFRRRRRQPPPLAGLPPLPPLA